jgi:hypothetical protein
VGKIASAASELARLRKQFISAEARRAKTGKQLSDSIYERLKVLNSLAADRAHKVAELEIEKKTTLEELVAGLFCSKCRRSESQIKREEKVGLDKHIDDVDAEKVAMSKEEILEVMLQYEKKIQALRSKYDARIAGKENTYRDRIDRFRNAYHMADSGLSSTKYHLGKAKIAFGSSVGSYQVATHKKDSDWHAQRQLEVVRLGTKLKIVLLHREQRISAARKKLTLAIADGASPESVNRREKTMVDLIAARRQDHNIYRQDVQRLGLRHQVALHKRTTLRKLEEGRISKLVRQATGGQYRAMGIRNSTPWGYKAGGDALAQAHQLELDKVEAVRRGYDPATAVSDEDSFAFIEAAKRKYQRLREGATRMRRRMGYRAEEALQRTNRARETAAETLNDLRGYFRDRVLKHLPQATVEDINVNSWRNVSVRRVANGTVQNWLLHATQEELVWEMRSRVRAKTDGPVDFYDKTLEVDFIDPNLGGAAWHNPFSPEALNLWWDRSITTPAREILKIK